MAYLKPQSPLKDNNGDYIYPLTTADQIILENGSRLNSVLGETLPTATAKDEGKFLRVVNSIPSWQTIANAEEVSV